MTATESGTHSLVLERVPVSDSLDLAYSFSIQSLGSEPPPPDEVELIPRVFGIGAQDRLTRGNSYCLETRVAVPPDSAPAENVTVTLGWSPSNAIRLDDDGCSVNVPDGTTHNIGPIPAPGERTVFWGLRADREGTVDITLTATDASGATASATRPFTIVK